MPYSALRRDSRNPFQWVGVVGIWALSLWQLLAGKFPGQISVNTDETFAYAWGTLINFSSFSAMVGMIISVWLGWKRESNKNAAGLAWEAVGLYGYGFSLLVYSFTLFAQGKETSWLAATAFLAFGLAGLIRGWTIQRGLRRIGRGQWPIGTPPKNWDAEE